ncbi:MAG TPA: class I SAM-dependent methyltransferase [Candidatus Saccharimonadales bacterium]|nr:class I SAM-dependent methyltransferase [Candidatus Saccharimonadales bacterium]
MAETNPLTEYFEKNKGNLIHKWMHYFDIYHRHFARFRGQPVTIMEFGVYHGGSLQMWQHYFGRKARIIGVDINPACKKFAGKNIEIYIGDQEDRDFLRKLMKKVGPVDVVIEDGGHTMNQQLHTFEEVYPHVTKHGVFLIEDLHTSYWKSYGGGYRKAGTFIERVKDFIDELNAWHSHDGESFAVTDFTKMTRSMHIYDSIVVFEKDEVAQPYHKMTGKPTIGEEVYVEGKYVKL